MNDSQNDISAVVTRAKRQFPDHNVNCVFPVCLPIYELGLRVTVLAEHELSAPARFVLQLINLNVTQTEEIGRLLGIASNYVAGAMAELLGDDLVGQRADRRMSITNKGKQILSDGGKSFRPQNRYVKAPFDPLTKKIVDIDTKSLLENADVKKYGLFIAPTGPRKPLLTKVRLDEVKAYNQTFGNRRDKSELIEVSDIKDSRLKYRHDIILVELYTPNSNKPVFAAYRSQQYLEEESGALQRKADGGANLVPEELKTRPTVLPSPPIALSQRETVLLKKINRLELDIDKTEKAVVEAKVTQEPSQNTHEQTEQESRFKKLEEENNNLKAQLDDLKNELQTSAKVQIMKTEEHRPLLFHAIERASTELTIVSAFISPAAFDKELRKKISDAISKGTRVRIVWGMGTHHGPEFQRRLELGNDIVRELERLIPKKDRKLLTIKRVETHQKFIICDDSFCVWGSFNWLSYRGEIDPQYRHESSYYSERKDDINRWKLEANVHFPQNNNS